MNNPAHKRLLGLTLKYQRTHPEIVEGKREVGRISVEGRKIFNREALELFVKENRVKHALFDGKKTDEQKSTLIANHFLQKNKGNKQKALEEVTALWQSFGSVTAKDSALGSDRLRQLKPAKALSDEEQQHFVSDTKHMAQAPLLVASWILADAVKILQKKK